MVTSQPRWVSHWMGRFGLGQRSSRYALIAENGVITQLNAEQGGAFEVSSAEAIMEALESVEPNPPMVHSLVGTPLGC